MKWYSDIWRLGHLRLLRAVILVFFAGEEPGCYLEKGRESGILGMCETGGSARLVSLSSLRGFGR